MMKLLRAGRKKSARAADSSRRSFITGIGAGVSAGLASTAAQAGSGSAGTDDALLRLAMLEAENAVRKLHRDFQRALDDGRYQELAAAFTPDAKVVFNGGVFDQQCDGVSRLFEEIFRVAKSGASMQQPPGFELTDSQREERVEVSADCASATAVFPFSMRVGKPVETVSSLAGMARLQGEGVRAWWEGGVCDVSFSKDAAGNWKISDLEYRTLARADYRPGRSQARSILAAPFTQTWPEDPLGPDALI